MTKRPDNVWTMTEFRKNFDAVIEAVERGEEQLITRYGKPYSVVTPPTGEEKKILAAQDEPQP